LAVHLRTFTLKNPPSGLGANTFIPWYALHLTGEQAKDSVVETRSGGRGKGK
jgi:hypothetical protein